MWKEQKKHKRKKMESERSTSSLSVSTVTNDVNEAAAPARPPPTSSSPGPSPGEPFVLFCVCVVVCQIVLNKKKQRTHVTGNSLTSCMKHGMCMVFRLVKKKRKGASIFFMPSTPVMLVVSGRLSSSSIDLSHDVQQLRLRS